MRLVRTTLGAEACFSDRLATGIGHEMPEHEEVIGIYLGQARHTHYRIAMTLAQAKDVSARLQRAITRHERLEREKAGDAG
ncbi:MAG: hypothetical protein OXH14_06900 [Alphaproteobacteria bacterium]|nr:hypothetical protein [Alphaproteobacteria bacterium]MYE27366.1 hypothetical protein [Chloroflexota bacterium]